MTKTTIQITGRVIDLKSQLGLGGLRVEAWDKDLIAGDLVGSAITDEQGAFIIEFDRSYFKELFLDRQPDLFFKVFHSGELIKSTENDVLWNVGSGETEVVIEVDMPTPIEPGSNGDQPKQFLVQGQIRHADGNPFSDVVVRAFAKYMRSEELRGEVTTDAAGHYEIKYSAAQLRSNGKQSSDLIVRVFDHENQQLAVSPIQFNAPSLASVDIILDGDAGRVSEYDQLLTAITPISGGVQSADLTKDDVAFLVGHTGVNQEHLELLIAASQLAQKTELATEVFYGLLRQNVPADLPALLSNKSRDLRRALELSLDDNIIPAGLRSQLDSILATLRQLFVQHSLQPSDKNERRLLGDMLAISALSPEQRQTLLKLYAEREGTIRDFWTTLQQHPAFQTADALADLKLTMQLGSLTQNNIPLVEALHGFLQRDGAKSLRPLVKLDSIAWTNLINTPVSGQPITVPDGITGDTPEERIANYVAAMMDALRSALPTAATAHRVAVQPQIDLNLVRTVLEKNPQVDPGDFLPDSLDWAGISAADQSRARASLETLRKEIRMFPGLDRKALLESHDVNDSPVTRGTTDKVGFRNPIRESVAKVLANSQDLDLHATRIDSYLERNATKAFAGIRDEERPAVVNQLKRLQRVFRITPQDDQMNDLLAEGLDSAYSIANVPRNALEQKFADRWGGRAEVMKVSSRARHVSAATTSIQAQVSQAMNALSVTATGSQAQEVHDLVKKIPNWQNVFGSLSYCDCKHCSSVYGPAAYFVDLLHFLDNSGENKKHKTPLQVLLGRRPDLEYIKLSCQNAETTLPYVDLVNEILETYVALGKLKGSTAKDTGDTSADELSVNAQYVNQGAYSKLQSAHHPFTLPFSRSLEVVRTYLEHLGSSRYQVIKTFQTNGSPSDLAIACEFLKISPAEHAILTGTNLDGVPVQSPPELAEFYGYASSDEWIDGLHKVPKFLDRTGVTYVELIELLKTHFVNPNRSLTLVVSAGADQCDLNETRIHNLGETALRRIHRFIRLYRKLGWKIHELDRTITALGANDIDDGFLLKLAHVKQLQTELSLPLDQLLSFWAGIDTEGRDSLYIKLFQNKIVLNPVDPDFALSYVTPLDSLSNITFDQDWMEDQIRYDVAAKRVHFTGVMTDTQRDDLLKLSSDADYHLAIDNLYNMRAKEGTRLAVSDQSISDHANTILAALRISATDLEAIRIATGLEDADAQPVLLNKGNLATLYRRALLAKALRLTINDFLSLVSLTGFDPFKDPESTARFVDKVRKVQQSTFSVAQLNYVYRDVTDPVGNVAPLEASEMFVIENLKSGLRKIVDDTAVVSDPTGDLLRQKLGVVLDSSLVDPVMRVLDGTAVYSVSLATELAVLPRLANEIEQVGNNASLKPAVRFNRVLSWLMTYLRRTLSRSLIKQSLSDNLKINSKLLELLIDGEHHKQLLTSRADPDRAAIADFLSLGTPAPDDSPPLPPDPAIDAAQTYRLLHKIVLLVDTFRITVSEMAYLSAHGDDFAGLDPESGSTPAPFDLNRLPLNSADFKPALFYQWERLNDFFTLRNSLPTTELGLLQVFASPSIQRAQKQLTAVTNWDEAELRSLIGLHGFNLSAADFKNEIKLVSLQACWSLMKRLGVSAKQLFSWATHIPDSTQAQDVQNIVKAKYDDETWLNVAKQLNDVLRERQKAALVAYLLADPSVKAAGITDSSGLHGYFLIDVDMSPCMKTSRIVQASAAVQLFVQRCVMNLEDGKDDATQNVASSQIDSDAWEWMSQYRVWEANRKVFLYPENWILPELRDDKSPFFRELESELLQNDLTEETAEQAIMHYLEKLEEVARLEICGIYLQEEKEPDALTGEMTKVLHVVGRTFHSPHVYYYRRLPLHTGVWTAWERVTVEIEGDHLAPVFWNGRLYIFWPVFEEKPDGNQDLGGPWVHTKAELSSWQKYRKEHAKWFQEHAQWESRHAEWLKIHFFWKKYVEPLYMNLDGNLTRMPPEPTEPVEPTEPEEPSSSSQPSRTHWEIKLAWSEYRQGKWAATQTSAAIIMSNNRTKTLGHVLRDYGMTSVEQRQDYVKSQGFPTLDTVVQLYLPTPEDHFLKTTIQSDELVVEVYRRYWNFFDMFDRSFNPGTQIKDYEYLGYFKTTCGSRTRSGDKIQGKKFDSLALPNGATNSFMTLAHETGPSYLGFTAGTKFSLVLATIEERSQPYNLVDYHQHQQFALKPPFNRFFYQDRYRTYFVKPSPSEKISDGFFVLPANTQLAFETFFHPHVCSFIEDLNRDGVYGLLDLKNQRLKRKLGFEERYHPQKIVAKPYPEEDVDFASDGSYSLYNWELFFHIPLLIASRLSLNQKFAEAQQWFHYVFNPTSSSEHRPPKGFWQFQPFHENTEADRIQDRLRLLAYEGDDPDILDRKEQFENEVSEWEQTPFNPHLIARLRPIAYQKMAVMKYIDNLIAWGDYLFRQDTREYIDQATQLYVLAQDLLGPRPQLVAERNVIQVQTYHDLKRYLDRFSNSLVELENQFPFDKPSTPQETPFSQQSVSFESVAELQSQLAWSF